jgi:CRISPR-associated protein Csb3
MKYDIQVNPYNPVEYLACCGVLEILARFDPNAVSWWELDAQPRCWLETQIDETSLLHCLTQTLTDWNVWQASTNQTQKTEEQNSEVAEEPSDGTDDANDGEEANEGILLSPSFHLNDQKVTLCLDWWYETLTPQRKIKEKSAWKMYAGQQTAEKITRDMTSEAARLLQQQRVENISALLKLSAGMTGRFGFDPRSSRNALDTGFSANDLNLPIATYPFAEMLAGIAAQYFFPQRTRQGGGITSARGWIQDDAFLYGLWQTPLPIRLARLAATGAAIRQDTIIPLRAGRAKRDKYSNFKMALATDWSKPKSGKAPRQ